MSGILCFHSLGHAAMHGYKPFEKAPGGWIVRKDFGDHYGLARVYDQKDWGSK